MKTDALQAAIYSTLTGNSALMASLSTAWGVSAVFDHVPQVTDPENVAYFPYITISDVTASQWDTKGDNGATGVVQIDVWSRARGMLQARQIASAVYALLHYQPLTITGADHIWTDVETVESFLDPDSITRRAMLTVRVAYDNF